MLSLPDEPLYNQIFGDMGSMSSIIDGDDMNVSVFNYLGYFLLSQSILP